MPYVYVPKYEPGQFDDAPEDHGDEQQKNNELDKINIEEEFDYDYEYEEDFDHYFDDELNDNEEWDNASGGKLLIN